ncbi:hypothetical protein [Mesorhizobium sp. ANAO-SY3R2]|uniref:hypothetical protein n=1 Tax=Mesorhizobium sp. ANAO-SY3R2 TaxID=3166644 RepID=UPI00366FC838
MVISNFWGGALGLSSNQPGWNAPVGSYLDIAPAALASATFLAWPRANQVAYINEHGAGTPKSLELGTPPNGMRVSIADTKTVLLQLPATPGGALPGKEFAVNGTGRDATPAELATSPALLAPDVFLSWKKQDQVAYLQGKTQPVTIGGGQSKIFASAVPDVQSGAGVIQRTSGDDQPIPYYYLNGGAAGSPSSIIAASAEALFPSLDGVNNIMPVEFRPEDFNTPPSALTTDAAKRAFLASFSTWHSAYQLEYIKTHGTGGALSIADASGNPLLTAFISKSNPNEHHILQSLDKNAIATLSKADQDEVVRLDVSGALVKALGLSSNTATLVAQVQSVIDRISDDSIAANKTKNKTPASLLPADDQKPFLTQLEILKGQIENSGLVSPADVGNKVQELRERYQRAFEFFDVKAPQEATAYMNNSDKNGGKYSDPITVYYDVISPNGDMSGINKGYAIFIAQEKRIAELAEARNAVAANDGSLFGKKLDVPYLVYKLQSLYNLTLEAHVVMETEEINQQNALLKTYAAMQDIINRTLQLFGKADEGGKFILGKTEFDDYPSLSTEQKMMIAMFEDVLGSRQKHPLERLRGISRPLSNFFHQDKNDESGQNYDLVRMTHPQWSTIGTRLSETVTLINQNSQIKMNDINSLDKQRNRHFELANNALAKMNEILANISRT